MVRIELLSAIVLKTLLSCVDNASQSCGETPIVDGPEIPANVYSWMASLQYNTNVTFGFCVGSVISSWYILTAAYCVKSEMTELLGGLTGVRLGNFSRDHPICDYGADINCQHYQHFDIAEKIIHENYTSFRNDIERYTSYHNNIALLRLNQSIVFTDQLRRICLPFNLPELHVNTPLTLSGWGMGYLGFNKEYGKRAISIPLWDSAKCMADQEQICAGYHGNNWCDNDPGSPLMFQFQNGRMILEGILSHSIGSCMNKSYPTYFTNVRSYQQWIISNMRVKD